MKKSHTYPFSVKIVDYGNDDIEYEVVFNDFEEVIGVGDTPEEAVEDAYYNLDAYIGYCEEKSIPLPVPSKTNSLENYSGKMTIRLPKSLHRDLSEFAEKDGMSLNAIIIDGLRSYLSCESLKAFEQNVKDRFEAISESLETLNHEKYFYLCGYKSSCQIDNYQPGQDYMKGSASNEN
jgi:predicted HicB family RNase H-like nuclease